MTRASRKDPVAERYKAAALLYLIGCGGDNSRMECVYSQHLVPKKD